MSQQSDETIRAFVARLTATADMCGMTVTCTCEREVSYRNNVIQQLVIHGMRDNDIRIRVLSRNTSGELTTLDNLVNYIQAEEAGRNESSDLMSETHSINSIRKRSTFQKDKSKCAYCGQPCHTPQNTPEDRKSMCKAYGNTCSKCQKKNHLPSVCQSRKPRISAMTTPENENQHRPAQPNPSAEVSQLSSFFSLTATSPQWNKLDQLQQDTLPTSAQDLQATVNNKDT